ncbi:MAG: hypothetical protein WBI17_13160 [Clostridiaceae bacterium]
MALPNRIQYFPGAERNPKIDQEELNRQREQSKKLEKSRQELNRRNALRNNQMKMSVVMTIFFIASVLFVTIYRTSVIYSLQNDYVSMQKDTNTLGKANEALKAELIKASSINAIVEKSEELALVEPAKDSFLMVDLSRNNFKDDEPVAEEPNLSEKILSALTLNIFN